MQDFPEDASPETLLEALDAQVRAIAPVASERERAWREWPRSGDARAAERFREWFLLERASESLGAPPAAALAPRELGERESDPWTRLLEAQFRVLSVEPGVRTGHARLTDLWSGLEFEEVALPEAALGCCLLLGRIAPQARGGRLLPGWRGIGDPELADALADDLVRVRAEQARTRLSQREFEILLEPHLAPEPSAPAEDPHEALAHLLAPARAWSLERALAVLERGGAAALLDEVAFDSEIPLEPLRRLLAEWNVRAANLETGSGRATTQDAVVETERVDRALEAYDRARASGIGVVQAWKDLRAALDLGAAGKEEEEDLPLPDDDEAEAMGPEELPGLEFWIEAWLWERRRQEQPVPPEEVAAARQFARFVERLHDAPRDAAEISASDLWAHLAAAADPAELERRETRLSGWIRWLREEQDAFSTEDPAEWTAQERERLRASVALNAQLRGAPVAHAATAALAALAPPRVATEQGDWVEVIGIPARAAPPLAPGDLLFGCWESGAFRLVAWYPQRQPQPSPSES